jgi:formylglycine-generating enzyme required for sulfatase activity
MFFGMLHAKSGDSGARLAITIAVLLVSVGAAVWLSNRPRGDGDAAGVLIRLPPPPAADDPLNPAILIEGGPLPASQPHVESGSGPLSTRDEGISGTAVDGFWMQVHEVTNEEFRRYDPQHRFPSEEGRHPVVNITWEVALEYAISIGGLLPTESQWEMAARGLEGRLYPWGDDEPTCELAYFAGCGPRGAVEVMTHPAGATPDGVHDLAGNVWEWVMPDWFEPGKTPANDESRRMRGGSFDDEAFFLRGTNRSNGFWSGHRYISSGFRVVWPARERG